MYLIRLSSEAGENFHPLPPPPPNNAFSEFCRYMWPGKYVICTDEVSEVPTKYWKNNSF